MAGRWLRKGDKRRKRNIEHTTLSLFPLTVHLLTFTRQLATTMSATLCTGCNQTVSHPRYRLSHLSLTRKPACLAVKKTLLPPELEPSLSNSLPHSTPRHSRQEILTTPSPSDLEQTMADDRADPSNKTMFHDRRTSHDTSTLVIASPVIQETRNTAALIHIMINNRHILPCNVLAKKGWLQLVWTSNVNDRPFGHLNSVASSNCC